MKKLNHQPTTRGSTEKELHGMCVLKFEWTREQHRTLNTPWTVNEQTNPQTRSVHVWVSDQLGKIPSRTEATVSWSSAKAEIKVVSKGRIESMYVKLVLEQSQYKHKVRNAQTVQAQTPPHGDWDGDEERNTRNFSRYGCTNLRNDWRFFHSGERY